MFFLRRISGHSMAPAFRSGMIVIGQSRLISYATGDVVVLRHGGVEKIKRITALRVTAGLHEFYVTGDNADVSTDSRTFGWIPKRLIRGKILWTLLIKT